MGGLMYNELACELHEQLFKKRIWRVDDVANFLGCSNQ